MDFASGCTVFIFLVPQGMAYAIVAGMPPVYGLYSSTVPLFIYALLGTSNELSIGPMAITSLLLGVSCQRYGFVDGSPEYIAIATNISMIVGIILLFVGVCKLGALTNLISQSVLTGFLTASALVIGVNQLKYILGIPIPRFQYTHETIIYLLSHLNKSNPREVFLGLSSWIMLYLVREIKRRKIIKFNQPDRSLFHKILRIAITISLNASNLIAILLGALIARSITLGGSTIQIVGEVPSGILPPSFVSLGFSQCVELVPASMAIAFVSFAGNWAIAKKYASANNYSVDATQELIAYGFSNIIGVLFNSVVVSGGLARTAVNVESGAKSQVSGCITAVLILMSLLLLTSFFYYIPMAVLSAIIQVSIVSMIDFEEMVSAYKIKKSDSLVMVVTFLATFFVGVTDGLFVGIILSLSMIFHSTAFPHVAHLGKLPPSEGSHFKDVNRFSSAQQIPGVAIIRMDATLSFVNCDYFQKLVMEATQGTFHSQHDPIHLVIIDTSAWIEIDLPGIRTLFDLHQSLQTMDVSLVVACAKGVLRDRLRDAGFVTLLGGNNMCMSIEDALNHRIDNEKGPKPASTAPFEGMELVEIHKDNSTVLAASRQSQGSEDFMAGELATNPMHHINHLSLSIGSRDVSYTQLESYQETPTNI